MYSEQGIDNSDHYVTYTLVIYTLLLRNND